VDEILKLLFSAAIGGLLGGGALAKMGLGALENRMRNTFATKGDLNDLGERVTGVQKVASLANEMADDALEKARTVERQQDERNGRYMETLERVSKSMERIAGEMQTVQREQAKVAGILGPLTRDVERLFKKVDG
jgi:biopolymer transport protein ExbB/TolQ